MTKKIVISGYYGFDNLGDEAVLESILRVLRQQENDLEITVLSANPTQTAQRYGVTAVDRWKFKQILPVLQSADLLLSGGGSLLQDVTSQMTIPYYLMVVFMARMLGKKVAFYAQGVGPIRGIVGKTLTRFFGNRVQLITLRDEESRELLERIGVTKPPIEVMVDPVIFLEPKEPIDNDFKEIQLIHQQCYEADRPLVGIAPRPWKDFTGYKDVLIHTACRLQRERGAKILLIPMHQDVDLPFCQEMAREIPDAKILKRAYLPHQLLAVYQELDFLIGIRLHALIFAAVAGVNHLGISYDPKINNFLARLDDSPIGTVTNLTEEGLYGEIMRRLRDDEKEVERIRRHVSRLQDLARENAQMVLNLLN